MRENNILVYIWNNDVYIIEEIDFGMHVVSVSHFATLPIPRMLHSLYESSNPDMRSRNMNKNKFALYCIAGKLEIPQNHMCPFNLCLTSLLRLLLSDFFYK